MIITLTHSTCDLTVLSIGVDFYQIPGMIACICVFHSYSPLPADGIILRPCPKDHEGDQSSAKGVSGGVASSVAAGASIHDESFDDEFSDMEESITDGSIGNPCDMFSVSAGLECIFMYMYVQYVHA